MNKKKVCANCGKQVISHCYRSECAEWRKQLTQKAIKDCFSILDFLNEKITQENIAGTVEDYKKIKNVEKRVKELGNFEEPIKGEIERLKKYCLDLISNYFSPKDRKIGDKKSKISVIHPVCCTPKNIKLEKNDSEQYYYCDYCWETESPRFLKSLKSYHIDKLNKIMLDNSISAYELNSLNYQSMLTIPDFILTQTGIRDTYQKVEQDLSNFLKKKGINLDNQESRIKNQESRIKNQESRIKNQESRIKNQESTSNFPI